MGKQVSLRLPDGVWERAERITEHLSAQPSFEGFGFTPSRVLIQAILRGLAEMEAEHGLARKKGRRR